MGKKFTVRTCVLDLAGIPDLSDLTDQVIELAHIEALTPIIAIDDVNPMSLAYYPYAQVTLRNGRRLIIPLDRETRLAAAEHSIAVLRSGLIEPTLRVPV